jgi:hypothetical protein
MALTPAIRQWVGFYQQSLGWSPIPLAPKTKACYVPNYLHRDFGLDAFAADANLGLRSTNGLVVLDDDTIKRGGPWMQLDGQFLPGTPARWGRRKAPGSKFLYACPTLTETRTWKHLNDDHILQLRVGLQDMAPPSIYPGTGERLRWCGPLWRGMLQPIAAAPLTYACNLRATAVLIAQHWPAHGRRKLALA